MNNHSHSLTVSPITLPKDGSMANIFYHFANQPWAIFLDSADSQRQDGRYDIIVADPLATISTIGNTSSIWQRDSNQSHSSTENPLTLVQHFVDKLVPSAQIKSLLKVDLPFIAGAIGLFGYDLGKQFENMADKNPDEYTTPDMAVGIYAWSIIKDNENQQCYLCFLDQHPHPSIAEIQAWLDCPPPSLPFRLTENWQANMSQDQYTDKLARISDYLHAGDCYQINLAQRFTAHYQGDEWQAYLRLRSANHAPFSAFIRLDDAVVMSISPERFLSVKDQLVQTKPIKGTRPRSADPEIDQQQIDSLLSAEKDRAENLMIVDLLRNDLSKHCQPGTVKVPELFKLESFAAVHHLVSTVTGELKTTSSPLNLLQGAFPGGSITGAPKVRAMQIINELEPNNRNIYCGSIGYIGLFGDMDTSICIRTLLCEQTDDQPTMHCWAGGGIVLDSNAPEEYQESLDKVAKILPVLSADPTLSELM